MSWIKTETIVAPDVEVLGKELKKQIKKHFGRSLFIREIDSGSCNACEGEVAALTNPFYDMERFGLKIVASPKHADILLISGCVSRNMLDPLLSAYDLTPSPKWVITLGDCTQENNLFSGSYSVESPVSKHLPVFHHIPGCPPEPCLILQHLLEITKI